MAGEAANIERTEPTEVIGEGIEGNLDASQTEIQETQTYEVTPDEECPEEEYSDEECPEEEYSDEEYPMEEEYPDEEIGLDEIHSEIDEIDSERADIEAEIKAQIRGGKPDLRYLGVLESRLQLLNNFRQVEDPKIKEKALQILKNGDPVDYIIKVYNRLHIGDTGIGKVLLLSIACQSVINSDGLQPKLSGSSGKGKTHAAKVMFHLIPDVGYKLEGSLSSKSLYYRRDLRAGTIVFSDDIKMSDELEDTLKRVMSNFQQKTKHFSVNKDLEGKEREIPERIVWWLTSVDNPFSDELLNRLFGLDVDASKEMDEKVTEEQLKKAKYGENQLPEDEEVFVCRAIIHIIKGRLFKVDIPYSDRIVWKGSEDRRNLPRFLDLIRGFAVLRFMQRFDVFDNWISAGIKDFDDAKALYEEGQASLSTKLTKAELRLVKWMAGKGWLSINKIVEDYRKDNGKSYTYAAIRKIINGDKRGKGLTSKVPGMRQHAVDR